MKNKVKLQIASLLNVNYLRNRGTILPVEEEEQLIGLSFLDACCKWSFEFSPSFQNDSVIVFVDNKDIKNQCSFFVLDKNGDKVEEYFSVFMIDDEMMAHLKQIKITESRTDCFLDGVMYSIGLNTGYISSTLEFNNPKHGVLLELVEYAQSLAQYIAKQSGNKCLINYVKNLEVNGI